jgi:hypothetical protein
VFISMRQFFLASLGSFQLWIRDALSADSMVIDGGIATSVASSDLLALQRDRLQPYVITNCCRER